MTTKPRSASDTQMLHLVFGGELTALGGVEFRSPEKLDVVGIYPTYRAAYGAWKGAAQRTVDNALMRYFIIPINMLIEPAEPK